MKELSAEKRFRQCRCWPREGFQFNEQIDSWKVIYYSKPVACLQVLSVSVCSLVTFSGTCENLQNLGLSPQPPIKGGKAQAFIEMTSLKIPPKHVWWRLFSSSSHGLHAVCVLMLTLVKHGRIQLSAVLGSDRRQPNTTRETKWADGSVLQVVLANYSTWSTATNC